MDSLLTMPPNVTSATTPAVDPAALLAALVPQGPPPQDWPAWKARLSASKNLLTDRIRTGRTNVKRFRSKYFESEARHARVCTPDDFFLVSQKIAQLFYRVPEIQLGAKQPGPSEAAAPLFQAVINAELGADKLNIKATMDECLFDVVCPTAYAAFKIGYDIPLKEMPLPEGAPADAQPELAPAGEDRIMCERVPPGRLRIPTEFRGSDFDRAPWIGFRYERPCKKDAPYAKTGRGTNSDDLLDDNPKTTEETERTFQLIDAVWMRGDIFVDGEKDPDAIYEFEWIDGAPEPEPESYRRCPYVKFPGFPVKVLTIHYVSDSSLPPSDCDITRHMIDAQNEGLTQQLLHRQRTLPQNGVDTSRVGPDELAKIEANVSDSFIGFPFPLDDSVIRPIQKGQLPQEHYALENTLERKIQQAWSFGSNQTGTSERGAHTATEMQIIESNKDTRLDYERDKVSQFFLHKLVRPIAALLQQYGPGDGSYVNVLGPNGAQVLTQWTQQNIQGDFAFSIKINSQLRPDSQASLAKAKDVINFSAKSPFMNQPMLWRWYCEENGLDPTRFTIPEPTPPTPIAEPAPVSVQDLLLATTNPILLETLMNWKVPFPPEIAQVLQLLKSGQMPVKPPTENPTTPGSAPEADTVTKHVDTGRLAGTGSEIANMVGAKVM